VQKNVNTAEALKINTSLFKTLFGFIKKFSGDSIDIKWTIFNNPGSLVEFRDE
jgi:hypothetical protein